MINESKPTENLVVEEDDRSKKKKIFIPAIGSFGDVKPYLTLAKQLKKRDYLVWLGVHKRFEEQINAQGTHRFSYNSISNHFSSRYRYCGNRW